MKLVIFETASGTWHYHIHRLEPDEEPRYGGGRDVPTLCGKKLHGWDTRIPIKVWGIKDHMPSVWCAECGAERDRLEEASDVAAD